MQTSFTPRVAGPKTAKRQVNVAAQAAPSSKREFFLAAAGLLAAGPATAKVVINDEWLASIPELKGRSPFIPRVQPNGWFAPPSVLGSEMKAMLTKREEERQEYLKKHPEMSSHWYAEAAHFYPNDPTKRDAFIAAKKKAAKLESYAAQERGNYKVHPQCGFPNNFFGCEATKLVDPPFQKANREFQCSMYPDDAYCPNRPQISKFFKDLKKQ